MVTANFDFKRRLMIQKHGLLVVVDAIFIPFAVALLLTWVRSGRMRANLRAGKMMEARKTITKQFFLLLVDALLLPLVLFLIAVWIGCAALVPKRFFRWTRALLSEKNDTEALPNYAQVNVYTERVACLY